MQVAMAEFNENHIVLVDRDSTNVSSDKAGGKMVVEFFPSLSPPLSLSHSLSLFLSLSFSVYFEVLKIFSVTKD